MPGLAESSGEMMLGLCPGFMVFVLPVFDLPAEYTR